MTTEEKGSHENNNKCRDNRGIREVGEDISLAGAVREQYGVTVLAFGHDKDDETSVYQVLEVESMEKMQEAMSSPEIQKMRTDAGVNLDTQKLTSLVE